MKPVCKEMPLFLILANKIKLLKLVTPLPDKPVKPKIVKIWYCQNQGILTTLSRNLSKQDGGGTGGPGSKQTKYWIEFTAEIREKSSSSNTAGLRPVYNPIYYSSEVHCVCVYVHKEAYVRPRANTGFTSGGGAKFPWAPKNTGVRILRRPQFF